LNASNVANSSGLNFFQSPFSPLNVGTPDSADTPAPVEIATRRALLRAWINLLEKSTVIGDHNTHKSGFGQLGITGKCIDKKSYLAYYNIEGYQPKGTGGTT
jgi:hypothetical protein